MINRIRAGWRARHSLLTHGAVSLLLFACGEAAWAGKTLDGIRQRANLRCGVSTGVPGFSAVNSQGQWSGFDVDTCRAVAAAVLGDAGRVTYVPLNSQQRFTTLQAGEVDLLARNTSWNLVRDAALGLHFTAITYYDGQGFLIHKKHRVKHAAELVNADICVQAGTNNEKNLADYFRSRQIPFKAIVFDGFEAAFKAFFAGRCQVFSTDMSALAGLKYKQATNPDDYNLLPEQISKEPLGPLVRRGDDEWFAIVKWVIFALIEAEELGITQANAEQLRTGNNFAIRRLLGEGDDLGKPLGLDKAWSWRVIRAVGNYGEMFDRNLGAGSALHLPRGVNRLWNQGGLIYAPPLR
ncbi:MAG: amino acid ABC transporter substrate-binding protein [Burkholderiaceae bacterium]